MAYTAGSLDVQITAISDSAVKSLDNVIARLNSLSTVLKTALSSADTKWLNSLSTRMETLGNKLKGIDWKTLGSGVRTFTNALVPLQSVLSSLSIDNLKNITSLGTRFSTLGRKMNEIDWSKVKTGFESLTTAITPFIDKIVTAETSLKALNEVMSRTSGKKLESLSNFDITGGANKTSGKNSAVSNFNLGFTFAKLKVIYNYAKRIGSAVANITQYGVDFVETLNVWQVAIRNNLDQADEFIKKMNKAYGISQNTLMNAQATFKNMVSALGNISDVASYQISEAVTQMALDFSSLYNVTFEQAITKFQAALSGQVRPIRSVSGYDITESTLYQFYQELGGTKTVRQLNQTEKRLLSIYAVFRQMESSGAVGDLGKTFDTFANQSRLLSESFIELKTQAGLFFQELFQSWGILQKINAGVIFLTEIIKALTNYQAPDFLEDLFEDSEEANSSIEQLQGKLLDFDKIRALDSNSDLDSGLEIDKAILDSISQYQTVLDGVKNSARELAEKWIEKLGGIDNIVDKFKEFGDTLAKIAITMGIIVGIQFAQKIISWASAIDKATLATKLFNAATNLMLVGGIFLVVSALYDLIKNWDDLSDSEKAAKIATLVLGTALITVSTALKIAKASTSAFTSAIASGVAGIGIAVASLVGAYAIMTSIINSLDGDSKRIVSICSIVVGAIMAVTAAVLALKGVTLGGATIPIMLAGIGVAIAGVQGLTSSLQGNIEKHALGASDIDGGTLFIAGEAGKTEAVYSGGNGKSNVANISQLQEAFYNALVQYGNNNRGSDSAIVVQIDGRNVFNATRREANKVGLDFTRVR